jgi:hypothetical protein
VETPKDSNVGYSEPIGDLGLEILQQRIENYCQDIRFKPGIFGRVCTAVHGNRTEHLL